MRKKKIVSLVLIVALVMTVILPGGLTVYGTGETERDTFNISEGSIEVSAGTGEGEFYIKQGGYNYITTSQMITIDSNATTTNEVLVNGVTVDIMLDGVDIQVTNDDHCAFEVKNDAKVTLVLKEGKNNILKSGFNRAGVEVSTGQILTIKGAGALIATGGRRGAGIGGGNLEAGGTINISEGTVTATSGMWGAGIGGGDAGAGGTISISGGTVTATSVYLGAGIGGGNAGAGGTINISGGEVTATGGAYGAGVGSGYQGAEGAINISGGIITAIGGGSGAGIGSGHSGAENNISISGGEVKATGGHAGAGIGGGETGTGGMINISGGKVTATGSYLGAGIGGGHQGAGGTINISEGEVTATGGDYGAGIGGGSRGAGGTINISKGEVVATGGGWSAGIGGGSYGEGGDISISGGTITATGTVWGGAGIGGGRYEAAGNILISGGTVKATGGSYLGAGIGSGGDGGEAGVITIIDPAIVIAASQGSEPAIETYSGALSNESNVAVLIAKFRSWQAANSETSIYFKEPYSLYTSFAPKLDYKSIAFTVPSNSIYQLRTQNELQQHLESSTDFIIGGEGITTFNNVVNLDIGKVAADREALTEDKIKGKNINLANITGSLAELPTVGANGSSITWVSQIPTLISHDGQTVVIPAWGEGDKVVTLTATFTKGVATVTKVFLLTIRETADPDIAKVGADGAILAELIKGKNADLESITGSLAELPTMGVNGSTITWESSKPEVVSHDGQTVVRPDFREGNVRVYLWAILTKGDVTDMKFFSLTVLAYPEPSSGGGGGSSSTTPVAQPKTSMYILVDGIPVNVGTVVDTTEEGREVTTVTVDEQKLALDQNNERVTISGSTNSEILRGELSGKLIQSMQSQQATLEVETDTASYTLPLQQINLAAILEQLGNNISLQDIKLTIEVAKANAETIRIVESAANKGEFTIIAFPVEFKITVTDGQQTVEVTKFNGYIERMIAIPEGINPSKVTTGVVIDSDGTVRHVPTKVVLIEGKYYAIISSLTNSTYALISKSIEFKDVQEHWAKEAINDMSSRLVISGVGNKNFDPDRDIVRDEFATIMVRALGLKPGTGNNPFKDVKATDWYCDSIETAVEYNLISGYDNGKFGPKDKITREQAISIIARAMNTTGLKVDVEQEEIQKLLQAFGDASTAADYAKTSIATCIKAGVINSQEGEMDKVKENITRAETAVIIRRLLQKSNLIK